MRIRFLGHAAFQLSDGSTNVLIDPFLTGNPKAPADAGEIDADAILLSHGHGDHLGDTVQIAKRTGAQVVAIVELARELKGAGVQNVHDPNLGGTVSFPWGSVKLVPAWHTSTTPSGTVSTPAGLLVNFAGKTIYHLGDTALFSDLALVGAPGTIDLALVCIGGHYTMDRFDAVKAVELIAPRLVIPCHYGTFPAIDADAQAFAADVQQAVGSTQVVVLAPGESHTL